MSEQEPLVEPTRDSAPAVLEAKRATIHIEQKVSVKQYEPLTASIFLPVDLPEGVFDTPEYIDELHKRVRDAMYHAKVLVFEQLGLEYEDKNGVVMRRLAQQMVEEGPKACSSEQPPAARPSAAASGTPHPVFGNCKQCGGSDFYDNREGKRNPKGPDYKCKACNKAGWLTPYKG